MTFSVLMEILSTCPVPGESPERLRENARRIWEQFGSLEIFLEAPAEQWRRLPGMTPRRVRLLHTIRKVRHPMTSPPVTGPGEVLRRLEFLRHAPQERLVAVFLDVRHQVRGIQEVFRGTVCEVAAQPREIFQAALARNAARLIVAHNHPSGDAAPSAADREFTQRLRRCGRDMGLPLLDHLILTQRSHYSFAEQEKWRTATR